MRPNIVFIMTDQQRPDTVGALGCPWMRTPNLDALAARGVAFTNTYVQGATCTPSRASLIAGLYAHAHGAERNETWPLEGHPNWIEHFRRASYRTANIGKMHTAPIFLPCGFEERFVVENKNYEQGKMGPPDDFDKLLATHGLMRPAQRYMETIPDWFDRLGAAIWPYDEALFPDNVIGRRSVDCVAEHDFSRPLFLWVGFAGPHDPYDVPASALARYEGVELPEPLGFPGEAETKPDEHRKGMEKMDGWPMHAAIWWSRATPERIRTMRRHYFANVSLIDDWVGRIVDEVSRRGQLDNTLFVFTSDHGDALGDHGTVYKFSSHYESVVRVPCLIAGPGLPNGRVSNALVGLFDLGPTLLELAELPPLEDVHARSFAPLLRGETTDHRDAVFSAHGRSRLMARAGDWKLVFYPDRPYGELYHLGEDPGELRNRYDDPAAGAARRHLTERLLTWFASTA